MSTTDKVDLSSLRIDHESRGGGPSNKSSRTKYIIGLVLLILAAVAAYLFLSGSFAAAPEVETTTASLTYPSAANAVLAASGYVVAQQKAAIASKATGRLVFLGVEEGDKVKKGQIIARIEDTDVIAVLAQSQAHFELAQADLNDASQWLERARSLFASGTFSKAELDAADARFKRVEASIKAAEATVRASEVALENTRIRAPFDGTVLTKNANVGEVVAPFAAAAGSRAAVVTIADMSSLEVEADVSESNITRVKPGAPCEIVLDAYPEVRYQSFVHKIVPTADRSKATVQTKVRFRKLDERVLPEMSAKVNFLSKEIENAASEQSPVVAIPTSSVVSDNGDKFVYKVSGEVVHRVKIETGILLGSAVEVRAGLKQGDRVVLKPDDRLRDGLKVQTK